MRYMKPLLEICISIGVGVLLAMWANSTPGTDAGGIWFIVLLFGCSFLISLIMGTSPLIVTGGLLMGQLFYLLNQPIDKNNALWVVSIAFIIVLTLLTIITAGIGFLLNKRIKLWMHRKKDRSFKKTANSGTSHDT